MAVKLYEFYHGRKIAKTYRQEELNLSEKAFKDLLLVAKKYRDTMQLNASTDKERTIKSRLCIEARDELIELVNKLDIDMALIE